MTDFSRRTFLRGLAASIVGAGYAACGDESFDPESSLGLETSVTPAPPTLPADPFMLGVASGDPLHDRVVIWTRLAPEPLEADFGMIAEDVPVIWEVFEDEALQRPVRNGWTWARPEFAHSVHVDVDRLEPNRTWWYRFRVGDAWTSPVGRTRTFPAPDQAPERFVAALACCQKYRDGFYTAHDHLARMEVDAVFFLGDYIYESGNETDVPGRLPLDTELVTDLPGFRDRYGAYRLDPSLQEAHRMHPWIVTWDDHEVSNNYADLILAAGRQGTGDPVEIRRAGYQSWYEHMPVRLPLPEVLEDPVDLRIYRDFRFGTLASSYVLDTRQYRSNQVCDDEIGRCRGEPLREDLTILGEEQRDWLVDRLAVTDTRWNILAQQVVFGPVHNRFTLVNPDQWDGYMHERQIVLDALAADHVQNPIVFSGDVHAAGFMQLRAEALEADSPVIGYEVLTTSISSGGDEVDGEAALAPVAERLFRDVHFFDAAHRGFAICDFTHDDCTVTYWAVDTVSQPTSPIRIRRRYRIQADEQTFERLRDEEDPLPEESTDASSQSEEQSDP